jgi:hypothetical protein
VNRPGGRRGFENRRCRKAWASNAPAIRHREDRPAGRPASVGSGLDASRIADQDRGLPPTSHGEVIGRESGARSKRDGWPRKPLGIRTSLLRQLTRCVCPGLDPGPFQIPAFGTVPAHKRVYARLRRAMAGTRPRPIRAGWASVSPTLCKSAVHSEVVRIHPCPPVSTQQSAAVAQWQSGSLPTSRRGVRFSPAAPTFFALSFAQVAQR